MGEERQCALAIALLPKVVVAPGIGEDLGLFFRVGLPFLGCPLVDLSKTAGKVQ